MNSRIRILTKQNDFDLFDHLIYPDHILVLSYSKNNLEILQTFEDVSRHVATTLFAILEKDGSTSLDWYANGIIIDSYAGPFKFENIVNYALLH